MKTERLRDKINDGVYRFLESKGFERFCWWAMIFAALYFGTAVVLSRIAG